MFNTHTGNDPLVVHVPGWQVYRNVFTQLFKIQQDMPFTNVDLMLTTPDGVPESLVELLRNRVFSPVNPGKGSGVSDQAVQDLHRMVMEDHQKTWYQVCNQGFQLEGNMRFDNLVRENIDTLVTMVNPVIVDPLLCFLAPLWKQQLIRPVMIFCYRDPIDCAHLLQKTWRFPLQFALALWEYYVINAVSQICGEKYLLFSLDQYRKSPATYLEGFVDDYRKARGIEQLPAMQEIVAASNEHDGDFEDADEFLTPIQKRLFEALEVNDLDAIKDQTLSAQAKDLLFHYGNLRSGFESGGTSNHDFSVPKPTPTSESIPQPEEGFVEYDTDEPLVEITVHIEGLPPQEFISTPDNPVLEVLNNALQNQSDNPGEMIYLQSAESETGAIYFAAGDLLAVETHHI